MLQDVGELERMQLGIGRHGGKPGMPDTKEQLEVFGRVLGDDGDAVAKIEPEALAQRAGKPRSAAGKIAIAAHDARADGGGRRAAMAHARAVKPKREVHG